MRNKMVQNCSTSLNNNHSENQRTYRGIKPCRFPTTNAWLTWHFTVSRGTKNECFSDILTDGKRCPSVRTERHFPIELNLGKCKNDTSHQSAQSLVALRFRSGRRCGVAPLENIEIDSQPTVLIRLTGNSEDDTRHQFAQSPEAGFLIFPTVRVHVDCVKKAPIPCGKRLLKFSTRYTVWSIYPIY